MAIINLKKREIQLKIVYYGPGRGGKTTNLEYIRYKNKHRSEAKMVKIETPGERTLLFDFFLFEMGRVNGFDVKIHLYSAPGQRKYESCRRLVLNGVDGVVFVADSMTVCRKRNLLAFDSLKKDLIHNEKFLDETPIVIQCNKADLVKEGVSTLSPGDIARDLGVGKETPVLEASAMFGKNVVSTLKKIIVLTLESIEEELKIHSMNGASSSTPRKPERVPAPARAFRRPVYSSPRAGLAYAPMGA